MNMYIRYSLYGMLIGVIAGFAVFIPLYSTYRSYHNTNNNLITSIQNTPTNMIYTLLANNKYAPKTLYYGTLLKRFMNNTITDNDMNTLKNDSDNVFLKRFNDSYKAYLYNNDAVNSDDIKRYESAYNIDYMDSWLIKSTYLDTQEKRNNHYTSLKIDVYKPQQIVDLLAYMQQYEPLYAHQNIALIIEKSMHNNMQQAFITYLEGLYNSNKDVLKYYRNAYKQLPESVKTVLLDSYYNPKIVNNNERRIGNIASTDTINSDNTSLESIFKEYKIVAKTRDNDDNTVNFYDAEYRDLVFSGVYNSTTNRFLSVNISDKSYANLAPERLMSLLKSLSRVPAKPL